MNCRDLEKTMYLYEESTPAEKKRLDLHMATCSECRKLFDRQAEGRAMVKLMFPADKPDFPGALSERIITAVKNQDKRKVFDKIFEGIGFTAMRYTFASLSLVMVVAFLMESRDHDRGKPAIHYRADGIELKSTHILQNVLSDRKRGSLLTAIRKQQTISGTPSPL